VEGEEEGGVEGRAMPASKRMASASGMMGAVALAAEVRNGGDWGFGAAAGRSVTEGSVAGPASLSESDIELRIP
jgi:hypothetical protein